MRARGIVSALIASAVLGIGACGDDDSSGPTPPGEQPSLNSEDGSGGSGGSGEGAGQGATSTDGG